MKLRYNICLVYTLIWLQVIGFGGPIALHGSAHFLKTTGPSLTKVLNAYFDRISSISLCLCIVLAIMHSKIKKRVLLHFDECRLPNSTCSSSVHIIKCQTFLVLGLIKQYFAAPWDRTKHSRSQCVCSHHKTNQPAHRFTNFPLLLLYSTLSYLIFSVFHHLETKNSASRASSGINSNLLAMSWLGMSPYVEMPMFPIRIWLSAFANAMAIALKASALSLQPLDVLWNTVLDYARDIFF